MAKQSKIDFRIFKRLLKFAKPYSGLLILALLCTILLSIIGPLRPMIIGNTIQKYVVDTKNPSLFLQWILIVAGILLVEALLQFMTTYFSNFMAQSVIRDIRVKVFNNL
jgi:ATP-binding cassette, subfamily B, multidrug efflux pump